MSLQRRTRIDSRGRVSGSTSCNRRVTIDAPRPCRVYICSSAMNRSIQLARSVRILRQRRRAPILANHDWPSRERSWRRNRRPRRPRCSGQIQIQERSRRSLPSRIPQPLFLRIREISKDDVEEHRPCLRLRHRLFIARLSMTRALPSSINRDIINRSCLECSSAAKVRGEGGLDRLVGLEKSI